MAIPDVVFRGRIVDGQIRISEHQLPAFKILKESMEGDRVEIILRRENRRPSWNAHKYYRSCCLPYIARAMEVVESEAHAILTRELIPVDVERPELGGRSTADLSEAEFSEFIAGVKGKAAFLGLYIPEPGEVESRREGNECLRITASRLMVTLGYKMIPLAALRVACEGSRDERARAKALKIQTRGVLN